MNKSTVVYLMEYFSNKNKLWIHVKAWINIKELCEGKKTKQGIHFDFLLKFNNRQH